MSMERTAHTGHHRRALVLVLLALCGRRGAAHAEPTVRVRADSRIELGVTHLDVGMSITGALRDELGLGLGERSLELSAIPLDEPGAPFEMAVRTNAAGEFSLEIADGNHDYRLLASFDGDAGHRGVRVERSVERARSDVRLELRIGAGSRLDLDAPELALDAVAESDAGGQGITLRLSDETGRELALARTDAQGRARFVVPTDRFGPPGTGLLRVESLRDERHAEAQTEARVIRSRQLDVSLEADRSQIELGSELAVHGAVRTRTGACPRLPVGLYVGREHVRTVVTDEAGEFSAELSADSAPARTTLSARVEADPSGAHRSASASVPLAIVAPEPLPLPWLLGLFGVGALVTLLVSGRRRRPAAAARASVERRPGPALGSVQEGRVSFTVSGCVLADDQHTPLPGAQLQLVAADGARSSLVTDAQGRFMSAAFPPGPLRIQASARGWSTISLTLVLPHAGEGEQMTLRLESLRARAVRAFRRAVEPSLPFPRAFALWTTREVRAFLAQRRPGQRVLLGELARELERAAYAAEPPSEGDVAHIEQRATALAASPDTSAQGEATESAAPGANGSAQSPSAR
jgi:Carboxypeptidase regulatory-like domain